MSNLASKLGQIGPKWDKSVTFKDQFSVHFGAGLKTDLKKSWFLQFRGQFDSIFDHLRHACPRFDMREIVVVIRVDMLWYHAWGMSFSPLFCLTWSVSNFTYILCFLLFLLFSLFQCVWSVMTMRFYTSYRSEYSMLIYYVNLGRKESYDRNRIICFVSVSVV